jgi:uncharacterized protein (DUF983 family)
MRPPLQYAVLTALRFRCPNCREGPVFRNRLNGVLRECPKCGLPYFRESGYYLGGMIITYIFTAVALLAGYLFWFIVPGVRIRLQCIHSAVWVAMAIGLTLAFVRPAYSLWLALDFWLDPWEAKGDRARVTGERSAR